MHHEVSAGKAVRQVQRTGAHHEHQLARPSGRSSAGARIMSISWQGPGVHHEHQLAMPSGRSGTWAHILSISWQGHQQVQRTGAHHEHQLARPSGRSSAWARMMSTAGKAISQVQHTSAHHEHQLARPLGRSSARARIMSMSRQSPQAGPAHGHASWASAGKVVRQVQRTGVHHEHQLARPSGRSSAWARMMSISWQGHQPGPAHGRAS